MLTLRGVDGGVSEAYNVHMWTNACQIEQTEATTAQLKAMLQDPRCLVGAALGQQGTLSRGAHGAACWRGAEQRDRQHELANRACLST